MPQGARRTVLGLKGEVPLPDSPSRGQPAHDRSGPQLPDRGRPPWSVPARARNATVDRSAPVTLGALDDTVDPPSVRPANTRWDGAEPGRGTSTWLRSSVRSELVPGLPASQA